MLCHIKTEVGFLQLELLRDHCLISAFPWGIPCLDVFKYNTYSNKFFVKSDQWVDFSTIENHEAIDESINDIFTFLNVAQIAQIKNIVQEAVKWTEFWHSND